MVADLCCGHGLAGLLFAIFEREVERVHLVDRERPASADLILQAAADVAPGRRPRSSGAGSSSSAPPSSPAPA